MSKSRVLPARLPDDIAIWIVGSASMFVMQLLSSMYLFFSDALIALDMHITYHFGLPEIVIESIRSNIRLFSLINKPEMSIGFEQYTRLTYYWSIFSGIICVFVTVNYCKNGKTKDFKNAIFPLFCFFLISLYLIYRFFFSGAAYSTADGVSHGVLKPPGGVFVVSASLASVPMLISFFLTSVAAKIGLLDD